ncbi:MAG TPA: DUF4124 domain-containing protein [Gallionella sp.]|jgi:hypothetical protein|nr:DUF4124 domain-containing protein [Gallionella sp.]
MTKYKLLAALVVGIAFSLPAAAKLYKWVDDKGVTHYGETVPPEYASRDREELNKAGRVVEKKEVLTPEERSARDLEELRKRENQEAVLEQRRRDSALLSTYSNVKEIDLARSRNLQQVEARVNSIGSQLKMADNKLAGLQKEADGYTKSAKEIPASLRDDLQESQVRQAKLQQDLEKSMAEKAAVETRYDTDKARYKELTGKE